MTAVKRSSTHRQRQAQQTQALIVDAAQRLFFEQGYGVTTIEAVAEAAGVAVSTVYNIFGSKRGVLKAIRERWHEQSQVKDIYAAAMSEPDPARRLESFAHATRRQWEVGAVTMAIYQGAAATDAEAAAELQEALSGRRRNVGKWLEQSHPLLRPDLSPERLAAIHLALTRPEVYLEFVESWGWTPDEYETWLAAALKQQFLPSAH